METHLCRQINVLVQVIQKPLLCGESSDSDDAFQQLTEVGKNRTTTIRFHPSQVASCIEIPDSQDAIDVANYYGRENEKREDITEGYLAKIFSPRSKTYMIVKADAANTARDELTACSVPARDESTVSTSLLNRFSMRPFRRRVNIMMFCHSRI